MKWFLIVPAVLVLLVAIVVVIGAVLPPEHVASRTVRFESPPERIWEVITDYPAGPSWRPGLRAVQQLPDEDEHPVWQEIYANGGSRKLQILESSLPRFLLWKITDQNLPFRASWTIIVTELGEGSLVTVVEDRVVDDPFFRLIAVFSTHYADSIDEYLKALARELHNDIHIGAVSLPAFALRGEGAWR